MNRPNITVGMLLAVTASSLKPPSESTVDDVITRNLQAHKANPCFDQVLNFSDAVADRILELLPEDLKTPREIDLTGKPMVIDLDPNEEINVTDTDGSSGSEGDANEGEGNGTGSSDSAENAGHDGEDSAADMSTAGDASAGPAGDVSAETSAPSQPQPSPAPTPKPQNKPNARK